MIPFFYVLAWGGFVASLAAHLCAFFGYHPPMELFLLLQIGIFVVFLPTVLVMKGLQEPGDSPRAFKFGRCPRWMRIGVGITFAYVLLNMVVFGYVFREGQPQIRAGKYFISPHVGGDLEITEAQYRSYGTLKTLAISSGCMMFYFWSLAGLRAKMEKDKSDLEKAGSRSQKKS